MNSKLTTNSTTSKSSSRRICRPFIPRPLRLNSEKGMTEEDEEIPLTNSPLPSPVHHILPLQLGEQYCNTSVRGLLHLFLQARHGMTSGQAKSRVHLFGSLIYSSPLAAGMLADLGVGSFLTGVVAGMLLLIGIASLSFLSAGSDIPSVILNLSLTSIGLGLGGLKPSLQALASEEVEVGFSTKFQSQSDLKSHLMKYFQSAFLWSNIGILAASLLAPLLIGIGCESHQQCYPLGFGAAALVACITLVIFLTGRFPSNSIPKPSLNHLHRDDLRQLMAFFVMCLPLSFFWMLYDQGSTAWQDQYEHMTKDWSGIEIKTELMANTGSFLLLIFLPLLTKVIDPWLQRRDLALTGIPRMALAFTILILAFIISSFNQYQVESLLPTSELIITEGRVTQCLGCPSGIWQLPQWTLLALGEALLGTATPQLAHLHGGTQFRSLGPGLLLLTNAIGNGLVLLFDNLLFTQTSPFLTLVGFTIIATIANLILILMYTLWFRYRPTPTTPSSYAKLPPHHHHQDDLLLV